jgi:hypothetical protein
MRRRAAFVAALLTISLAGCGTTASSPSPVASPSPAATAVPSAVPSPSPTRASTPVPTWRPTPEEPTPTPAPTMTTDDVKIDGIVKDGVAKMIGLSGQMDSAATMADVLKIIKAMKSLADTQVTVTDVYTASACTQDAWTLYSLGMTEMSSGADAVLAWVKAGAVGSMPADDVGASATTLAEALNALQASTC